MSPRRLSGWEPAEVTTYEYDGDRLVRSVTVREAEFSPDDVAVLLESRRTERVPRGSHGFPLAIAMDPGNQFRFKPVGPRVDWAAKAVAKAEDDYKKQNPGADMTGLRFGIELV